MFRLKICGITTVEDALAVASSGADAIGLNFYSLSKRYVEPAHAKEIAAALPDSIAKVGVFVNATREEIEAIRTAVSLDWVQLHGDEPPEFLATFGETKILRALRLDERGLEAITTYLKTCESAGRLPDGLLIDAHVPGQYGGSGETADWQALGDQGNSSWRLDLPWALAGGLTPENVAEAILATRPNAVDTASGVESAPGKKDPALCKRFVAAARTAFN